MNKKECSDGKIYDMLVDELKDGAFKVYPSEYTTNVVLTRKDLTINIDPKIKTLGYVDDCRTLWTVYIGEDKMNKINYYIRNKK